MPPSTFTVRASIDIARPVESVYAYLARPDNYPRWIDDLLRVEAAPRDFRAGDPFEEVVRFRGEEKRSRGRILEAEPGRRVAMEVYEIVSGPRLLPTRRWQLEPSADGRGTRVDWSTEVRVEGLMRLMKPLLPRMFRQKKAAFLAALKRNLEAGAGER